MPLKFYGYAKCSTCQKAKKLLVSKKTSFDDIDITVTPPSKAALAAILKQGDYKLRELFNTSGEVYRSLDMKNKIDKLSESALLDLLAKNGKLVKRPIVTDGKRYTVGFKEEKFQQTWG